MTVNVNRNKKNIFFSKEEYSNTKIPKEIRIQEQINSNPFIKDSKKEEINMMIMDTPFRDKEKSRISIFDKEKEKLKYKLNNNDIIDKKNIKEKQIKIQKRKDDFDKKRKFIEENFYYLNQ